MEAVRLVESGRSIAEAERSLGVIEQTLSNWIKAHRAGKLTADGRGSINTFAITIS
jgi:transposase